MNYKEKKKNDSKNGHEADIQMEFLRTTLKK